MHELSLALALFDRLDALRAEQDPPPPAARVREVRVRIGEASGVEPSLFATAFEAARGPRGYTAADLAIAEEAAAWRCPACGAEQAEGPLCPTCDAPCLMIRGEALYLDRLAWETDDV